MAKVLVSGSAGAVGEQVCRELAARGHRLRGLDRVPTQGLDDCIVADIGDLDAVRGAVAGVDVVVHLAAEAHDRDFPSRLVGPNVVGLYNVLHAARQEKVPRVILASSMQVAPERPGHPAARADESAPLNHYALSKLWAEQMGEMYARCFGLRVLCARLCWMVRNVAEARELEETNRTDAYISRRDTARFFALAVEADWGDFAVVFGGGVGSERLFDAEPARRLLGYVAMDAWPDGLPFAYPPKRT
ncbi:MAG: NAD(P)-dependent oxidoreductase [Verrucomicrobiota bacterium]